MSDLSLGIGLNVDWTSVEKEWSAQSKSFMENNKLKVKLDISSTEIERLSKALERLNDINSRRAKTSISASEAEQRAILQTEKIASQAALTRNRQNSGIAAQEKHEIALAAAKLRVQKAEQQLNKARLGSIGAIRQQNQGLQQQGFLLNGLKQFAGQYLSLLGAWRLFKNISSTTADFEMQRVALRALTQDVIAADKIFGQTMELAVRSPFTALELVDYTKKLAAYRIETENLFSVTKQLADVSAGLGVDMHRLITAFGQVRAASVLRGQEIRQFTEAGIPLIDLLAKKFTELRGEVVSTSEVFDLVSARQVPFQMVADIFEDMTKKGGTFYDMQNIQARTLKGIYANLADNIQQAFARIGNSQMEVLKGTGLALTDIVKNLDGIIEAGLSAAAMWMVYRASLAATTKAIGAHNVETIKTIKAQNAAEAAELKRISRYRDLNAQEKIRADIVKRVSAAQTAEAISSGDLDKSYVLRGITLGKYNTAQIQVLVATKAITEAEAQQAAARGVWTPKWVKGLQWVGRQLDSIGSVLDKVGKAALSFLTNPAVLIAGAVMVYGKIRDEVKKQQKAIEDSTRATAEAMKTLSKEMNEAYSSIRGVVDAGFASNASIDSIRKASKALEDIIRKNEELNPIIETRLRNITDEASRLREIKKIYDDIQTAAKSAQSGPNPFAVAVGETDAILFDKSLTENASNFYDLIDGLLTRLYTRMEDGFDTRPIIDGINDLIKGGASIADIYDYASNSIKKLGDNSNKTGKILVGLAISKTKYNHDLARMIEFMTNVRPGMTDIELVKLLKQYTDNLEGVSERARAQIYSATAAALDLPDYTVINRFKQQIISDIKEINGQIVNSDLPQLGLNDENFRLYKGRIQAMTQYIVREAGLAGSATAEALISEMERTAGMGVLLRPDLGAWQQIANTTKLFEDDELKASSDFVYAQNKIATSVEESTKKIEAYREAKIRAAKDGNDDLVGQIDGLISSEENLLNTRKIAQKQLNAYKKDEERKPRDTRLQTLKEELKIVQEAYRRYLELRKLMSDSAAQEKIKQDWAGVFASFTQLKGQQPVFDIKGITTAIEEAIAKPFVDSKTKLELRADTIEFNDNEWEDAIQKELDKIANRISLNSILSNHIGSISTDIIKSIMESGISEALKIEGEAEIDFTQSIEDIVKQIEIVGPKLNDATRKMLEDYIKYLKDSRRKEFDDWNEYLIKYGSYSEKELAIRSKYAKLIEESQTAGGKETLRMEEREALDEIQVDMLKQSAMWVRMFGDAERVTTKYIKETRKQIQDLLDYITGASKVRPKWISEAQIKALTSDAKDATETIKMLMDAMDKQSDEFEKRNPFGRIIDGLTKMSKAQETLAKKEGFSTEEWNRAEQQMYEGTQLLVEGFGDVADAIGAISNLIAKIGIEELDEVANTVSNIADGAKAGYDIGGGWGALIGGIIGLGASLVDMISGVAGINREIQYSEIIVKRLQGQYNKLERAIDNAFGVERVRAFNEQLVNMYRQSIELRKQAELEAEKGKDTDWAKVEDLKNQAEEVIGDITDRIIELKEEFMGGDAASIAADLGRAFFDALKDGRISAKEAWAQTVDEIVANLVQKMLIAKFLEEPISKMIDNYWSSVYRDPSEIARQLAEVQSKLENPLLMTKRTKDQLRQEEQRLQALYDDYINNQFADAGRVASATGELENGLNGLLGWFSNMIDGPLSKFFQMSENSNLTGIAKAIGSLSEDTALTLAALENSKLYYEIASYNIMLDMQSLMHGWNSLWLGGEAEGAVPTMTAYQTEALSVINAIKADTLRIASSSEQLAADIRSVISANGTRATMGISIN